MIVRRALASAAVAAMLALTGAACAESDDDSGAVTKVEELGPQVAKLRLEVNQLRKEVRALREELALLTPPTDPETGLPLIDDTTGPSEPVQ